MKKSMFLIILWLLCTGCACAEAELPREVSALLESAYPDHAVVETEQWGPTAAAVLSSGERYVLCIAERQHDEWVLTIDSSTALLPGTAPSLLLDTDTTLFWTYHPYDDTTETYHVSKENGEWRFRDWMMTENNGNGSVSEYHLYWQDGMLHYATYLCDENENILSYREYEPVPAAWLADGLRLQHYDVNECPRPLVNWTHSWLPDEGIAAAAAELLPEYTFLGGCAHPEHLEFFLQSPNGALVLACCRYETPEGWQMAVSTPLPEGTAYGLENFSSSLVIGDLLVNVSGFHDGRFGVSYIYNAANGGTLFRLGQDMVTKDSFGHSSVYGDHPWDDITAIDWRSLPHTYEEACEALDVSGWAVVNNPNPEDRLHLRVKAERGAKSLGKYYNGTPARVLETRGAWAHVSIFGVEGWMMKNYLAFGEEMRAVEAVFPSRMLLNPEKEHFVYLSAETRTPVEKLTETDSSMLVLGIVGDEWYHVWIPELDLTGYVLQSECWEGNG